MPQPTPAGSATDVVGADEPVLELDGVRKTFVSPSGESLTVLDGISVRLVAHQFTVLVGPSGCGKTTLLEAAVGLSTPTAGEVRCFGQPLTELRKDVGYITQQANLFPWYTLRENVELPLQLRGVDKAERRDRAARFIEIAGLQGFDKHYPHQLSGGMQKRASIIRTLIYDPQVVLMDEPFGALDAQTRMIMQDYLLTLWAETESTVFFVTHDLHEAVLLADNVVLLTGRPTKVKEDVPIDLARPRNVFESYTMPGFVDTYDQIWNTFKSEVRGSDA
ncbi:MAG: ATP-binding cassette domain-containing protein [Streptosporangiales bacterium]|nr:ATP-binding cassette domain-containing protein [Streptosporangiales bacterium]